MTSKVIENYIRETIEHQSWKNYNELHINEIEDSIKEEWIEKGQGYFQQAVSLIKEIDDTYVVVLSLFIDQPFSLQNTPEQTMGCLDKFLDQTTPPSLIIMPRASGFLEENMKLSSYIGDFNISKDCYAEMYYYENDNEYTGAKSRILNLLGNYRKTE